MANTAQRTTSSSAKSRRLLGTTLLELLVVLTLIGAILGMGVGFASRLNFPRAAAVETVKGVLQGARAFAVTQGSLARVVVTRDGRSIQRVGFRRIGEWHFEGGGAEGAFGHALDLHGARATEEGRIGSALAFEDRGWAEAAIGALPAWETPDGLSFKADVRVDRGGGIVASKGPSWRVEAGADGSVGVEVTLASATKGEGARGERLRVVSAPGALLPGRWGRIQFLYDRALLRLWIDGIERARSRPTTEAVWSDRSPLRLSDVDRTLHGAIDEVSVSALAVEDPEILPEGVEFREDADVWFDAAGNLDPARHEDGVTIELVYEPGAPRKIEVTTYGTLR